MNNDKDDNDADDNVDNDDNVDKGENVDNVDTDDNVTDREFSLGSILQLVSICKRGGGRGEHERYFSSMG